MAKKTKIILGVVIVIIIAIIVVPFAIIALWRTAGNVAHYTESGQPSAESPAVYDMAVSYKKDSLSSAGENTVGSSGSDPGQSIDRLIIKTGRFSIVVKEVRTAVQAVNEYAIKQGGYTVSSDVSKTGLAPYATVVIRVPVKVFDEGVGEIKNLGEVESEYIEGQDVTEEFVDLDARLKNLRATEEQYLEIMKKAVKIEDILQVQNYLSNVRAEIESLQGRMKYLQQSADMSTITVYLSTDPEVLPAVDDQDKWKPWSEVKSAVRSLLSLGKSLSYILIWFAVYLPLWIVIALVGWLVYRKIKNRKTNL